MKYSKYSFKKFGRKRKKKWIKDRKNVTKTLLFFFKHRVADQVKRQKKAS